MTLTFIKARLAGLLLPAAGALTPPPVILPSAADIPADVTERERLYDRIAYTAIAWMGHVTAPEPRAATASILHRTYPGIGPHVAAAHAGAMAFNSQLQELLRAEAEAVAAAEAAAPATAAPVSA